MAEPVDIINIDLTELNQEANESKKTLKSLREEIKNLRGTLEETEVGTEDFTKALDQLTEAQNELKNATVSNNQAIEGSYNALVKEMGELKKQWKATADVQERAELGVRIREINDELKSLDETIGNHQRNVGDYSSAFDNLGQTIKNTSEATQGIVQSFGSAMLIMNNMGVESEEMTKIFKAMQLAMVFTNGLKSLEKGTGLFSKLGKVIKGTDKILKVFNTDQKVGATEGKALAAAETSVAASTTAASVAMKAFKAALISTGIGAIVVALGSLVSWMDKVAERAKEAGNRTTNFIEDLNDEVEARAAAIKRESEQTIAWMELAGAKQSEIERERVRALNKLAHLYTETYAALKAQYDALWDSRTIFRSHTKELEELEKKMEEVAKKAKEYREQAEDDGLFNVQIAQAKEMRDEEKKTEDARKKAYDDAKKSYEAFAQTRENNEKKILSIARESEKDLMSQYDSDRAEIFDWYDDQLKEFKKYEENELAELQRARKSKLITEEEYQAKVTATTKRYAEARNNLLIEYDSRMAKLEQDTANKRDQDIKASYEARVKIAEEAYSKESALAEAQYNKQMNELDQLAALAEATGDEMLSGQLSIRMSELTEQFYKEQEGRLNAFKANVEKAGQEISGASEKMTKEIGQSVKEIVEGIDLELTNLVNDGIVAATDTAVAKIEHMKESMVGMSDQMKDTVAKIISVGNGLSSEWTNVFDQLSAGIENVNNQLNKGEKGWREYASMAVSAVNVASSIMNALADEQDESTREGFEQQKKYQIAATTMNMLGGIVSAWTSAMNPSNAFMTIWGQLAAGTAMSAMILTTGLMQISKIKQQKFNGESTGSGIGPVATPSLSALQSMDGGIMPVTQIEGASTESQVKEAQKVYVLESDITSTVNKVSVSQSEATY